MSAATVIGNHWRKIALTIWILLFPLYQLTNSFLLSLALCTITSAIILFVWFSTTDLSVEITLFLAKVFPEAVKPVWNPSEEPYNSAFAKTFRENYKVILDELLEYEKTGFLPQFDAVYPNGTIVNWDKKWKTVTLRCYGKDNKTAQFFPKTMKIVNSSSIWLSEVMFSYIEAYKFIPRHRGPYSGMR